MAEQTSDIGLEDLSPINPEIMQYQATINIGRNRWFERLMGRYHRSRRPRKVDCREGYLRCPSQCVSVFC